MTQTAKTTFKETQQTKGKAHPTPRISATLTAYRLLTPAQDNANDHHTSSANCTGRTVSPRSAAYRPCVLTPLNHPSLSPRNAHLFRPTLSAYRALELEGLVPGQPLSPVRFRHLSPLLHSPWVRAATQWKASVTSFLDTDPPASVM